LAEIARTPAFRFRLDDWLSATAVRGILRPLGTLLDHVAGIAQLRRLYERIPRSEPFWDAALNALGVDYDVANGDVARIPPSGPLVIVANHPFGALDGLILMSLLTRVRPDVRLLANYLLDRIPQFREVLIPVDPFGAPSRRGMNAAAVRSAIRWLEAGRAVALFPAGEVSHAGSGRGDPAEAEWSPGAARLVQRTGADMLPIFFHGRNSRMFQFAGRLHPLVRTALLPRELLEKRGDRIQISVGRCIPKARLARLESPGELISYARVRTLALAQTVQPTTRRNTSPPASKPAVLAEAESPDGLEREIKALDSSQTLVRGGAFDVCLARSQEIPRTLLEIGRRREIAFRAAGEGSGQPRDVDRFDRHYLHLFVWDRERRAIAGAYRIGATDEILPRFGVSGLYTNTLFRFDERLLAAVNPALELGRAFVPPEYQRDYSPLLLLWRGIAAFVFDNPRYRMLFGPVSISNTYQSVSRQILARFLYATSYRADLGELVAPRNPPAFLRRRAPVSPVAGALVKTLADVGALLAEIEADQKGVPVLVRQYLKLNARLLGFNLDRAFGSALDGLMLVDLVDVDRTILARYMGAERAEKFLALHGAASRRRAS
jgi:putative hemolysin